MKDREPMVHESVYRDDRAAAERRRAILEVEYRDRLGSVPAELYRVFARRVARIASGAVLAAGGALMFGLGLSDAELWADAANGSTSVLLLAWPAALVIHVLVAVLAPYWAQRQLSRESRGGGDVFTDIARLQNLTPIRRLAAMAKRLEHLSIAVPMTGLALVGPLTIHGIVGLGLSEFEMSLADFDSWIHLSAFLVGHCHLVLVYYGIKFAGQVRALPTGFEILPNTRWKRVFFVILWSVVPGGFFILIPVVLVALTAAIHAPVVYGLMARAIRRERTTLVQLA